MDHGYPSRNVIPPKLPIAVHGGSRPWASVCATRRLRRYPHQNVTAIITEMGVHGEPYTESLAAAKKGK